MSTVSSETVLLTGATGFVGRELLWRLARTPGKRVVCLIRATSQAAADSRLAELLGKTRPHPLTAEQRSRVAGLAGDVTLNRLALPKDRWTELATSAHRVLHCAASVDWAEPLEALRETNVNGTRRVIELGNAAHTADVLRRFDFVSTCNVCGRREGLVREADLDDGAGFFNAYEREASRCRALVRARRPAAALRRRAEAVLYRDAVAGSASAVSPRLGHGRTAIAGDCVGGFDVPAGAFIVLSPYVIQRDARWWDEPEAFDPTRFSPERSETRHRLAYFPFAAGPRMCVARDFAMIEAQLIVASILQRFRLEGTAGPPIRPVARYGLEPSTPLMMRIKRRQVEVAPSSAGQGRYNRVTSTY